MVQDTLGNAARYTALHPGFRRAFEWLAETDLTTLEAGRHEIDGERLFAIVDLGPGRGRDGAKREQHEHYIDIQVAVAGADEIGWRPTAECHEPVADYDPAKDVRLWRDEPWSWSTLPPGTFAIYWPEDVHAPKGADPSVELRKVVVKVKVAW